MMAGAASSEVQSIVDDLVIHTAKHFSHEEREMRAAGYSLYAWHHRQHHTARFSIRVLERRIRRGDRAAGLSLRLAERSYPVGRPHVGRIPAEPPARIVGAGIVAATMPGY